MPSTRPDKLALDLLGRLLSGRSGRLLRKAGPGGAILLFTFLLPFLLLSENFTGDLSGLFPGSEQPAATTAPSGPVVDAFRPQSGFEITQNDANRAAWTWSRAKALAADVWSVQTRSPQHYESFYCGCDIARSGTSSGTVDAGSCGFQPRKNAERAARLEWEHVMPAAVIGRGRSCWSEGAPQCVDNDGKPFRGRSCCMIADPAFAMAANDPVNLVPAIGEVNADRSDFAYGIVPGETRSYGRCDMEIDTRAEIAEPPAARQGDVARIWAYMSRAYGITLSRGEAETYRGWIAADPVSEEEIRINRRIQALGHRPNPFVLDTRPAS